MKKRIFTICIMVAALAMFAPVAEADFKATGGGWLKIVVGSDYSRPTFGFQMKCKGDDHNYVCIGNLQYNDRDEDIKIHSTEVWFGDLLVVEEEKFGHFEGSCRIQSKYYDEFGTFILEVSELGLSILIDDKNPIHLDYRIEGDIGEGNIKIQVK